MSRIGPMSQIGLMGKRKCIIRLSLFIFPLNSTGFSIIHYSLFI